MKVLVLFGMLALITSAEAGPLLCEGREVLASGLGPVGSLRVNVYPMSATFTPAEGERETLISSDAICGVSLIDSDCRAMESDPENQRERTLSCQRLGAAAGTYLTGRLLINEAGTEGRVRCEAPAKKRTIRFTGCQPEPTTRYE